MAEFLLSKSGKTHSEVRDMSFSERSQLLQTAYINAFTEWYGSREEAMKKMDRRRGGDNSYITFLEHINGGGKRKPRKRSIADTEL